MALLWFACPSSREQGIENFIIILLHLHAALPSSPTSTSPIHCRSLFFRGFNSQLWVRVNARRNVCEENDGAGCAVLPSVMELGRFIATEGPPIAQFEGIQAIPDRADGQRVRIDVLLPVLGQLVHVSAEYEVLAWAVAATAQYDWPDFLTTCGRRSIPSPTKAVSRLRNMSRHPPTITTTPLSRCP